MFLIIYLILTSCVAFFKKTLDTYEKENEILIDSLHSKTVLIESQNEELESQGEILRQLLFQKDNDLSKVTQELIKFNHDLLQYSYTISHNVRGPVARILGLLDLLKREGSEQDKKVYLDHMLTSTQNLDDIMRDLNRIVEMRTDSYVIRERFVFEDHVDQIIRLLSGPINNYGIQVSKDFSVKDILSASSRLNHVLFSLISNAIQFRRENTIPEIRICTYNVGKEVVLEIRDNGRGMDLASIGDNLFQPFKRFHPEVSGKGIGLFLVKLQVERLHGRVEVRSTPDKGTTFLFYLKDWNDER